MMIKTVGPIPTNYEVCGRHNEPIVHGVCQYCAQEAERTRAINQSEVDYEGWDSMTLENVDDIENIYDNPYYP